jgi:hypothetical protein
MVSQDFGLLPFTSARNSCRKMQETRKRSQTRTAQRATQAKPSARQQLVTPIDGQRSIDAMGAAAVCLVVHGLDIVAVGIEQKGRIVRG